MPSQKRVNADRSRPHRSRPNADTPSPARKPKLGQHFLQDHSAAHRIVEALGDVSARTVIEIGPGRGTLTELLAPRAHRLIAIEIDRLLAAQLRMQYARTANVEIIEADVLTVNVPGLLRGRPEPLLARPATLPRADVIGNLPYFLTSDILLRLFDAHEVVERVVVMVQLEVADRITAAPGTSEYGLLSATAQLHGRVEKLFTLFPGAFAPPPKVHSAVLRLTLAPSWEELGVRPAPFIDFLKLSFAHKRKTLVNNLRGPYREEHLRSALKMAGIRPDVRAEALSLEQAAQIFRALWPGRPQSLASLPL